MKALVNFTSLPHVHCLIDIDEMHLSTRFTLGMIEHGFDLITRLILIDLLGRV